MFWLFRRFSAAYKAAQAGPKLDRIVVDDDGWMQGDGIRLIKAHPRYHYRGLRTPSKKPIGIVAHYTVTGCGTAIVMAKARQKPPGRAASWHISIECDGSIVQMVSLLDGAWHAGGGKRLVVDGKRYRYNCSTVGIELVSKDGKQFPREQVFAAKRVWRAIVDEYDIPKDRAMIPHSDIISNRSDPGPVWMNTHAPRVLAHAFDYGGADAI